MAAAAAATGMAAGVGSCSSAGARQAAAPAAVLGCRGRRACNVISEGSGCVRVRQLVGWQQRAWQD